MLRTTFGDGVFFRSEVDSTSTCLSHEMRARQRLMLGKIPRRRSAKAGPVARLYSIADRLRLPALGQVLTDLFRLVAGPAAFSCGQLAQEAYQGGSRRPDRPRNYIGDCW